MQKMPKEKCVGRGTPPICSYLKDSAIVSLHNSQQGCCFQRGTWRCCQHGRLVLPGNQRGARTVC